MRPNDCTNRHAENCLADARRDVFRPRPFVANVGICGGLILICTRGGENLMVVVHQNVKKTSVRNAIDFSHIKPLTFIHGGDQILRGLSVVPSVRAIDNEQQEFKAH
jgi:hypothetical protein